MPLFLCPEKSIELTNHNEEIVASPAQAAQYFRDTQGKFRTWAWSPVIVVRIALAVSYLLTIAMAVTGLFAAYLPSFHESGVANAWWWSGGLVVFATAALLGSTRDKWQSLEKWASLGVLAGQALYVSAVLVAGSLTNNLAATTAGLGLMGMMILPLSRFLWLASRAGRKVLRITFEE